jgi:hypothetical protein
MKILTGLLLVTALTCFATLIAFGQPPLPPPYIYPHAFVATHSGADTMAAPLAALLGNSAAAPWLKTILMYIGAFGVFCKWFAPKVQQWLSDKLAYHTELINSDHDKFVLAVLQSKTYRSVAFVLDLVFSINAPSVETYKQQLAAQNTLVQTGPPPTAPAPK